MKCHRCKSESIVCASAKCSDMFNATYNDREYDGYVPSDLGIGSGDCLEIDYCLNCGQIQGLFPTKPNFSKWSGGN